MRCSCASAGSSSTSYRMIVEAGHVVDVLLREHRDTASAEAFFRRAQERTAGVVSDLPGQRFLEKFEALCTLGHGHVAGVPTQQNDTSSAALSGHRHLATSQTQK